MMIRMMEPLIAFEEVDIFADGTAVEILKVQTASYQVESRLIEYPDFPPLWETAEKLRASGERFVVCRLGQAVAGAASFAVNAGAADICRLVVSPEHFGKGIGSGLVRCVERLCRACRRITVSTAWRNTPAVKLYEKLGYRVFRRWHLPDRLELVEFEKLQDP